MRKARARRHALGAAIAAAVMLAASPVIAQGWWPWSNSEPERERDRAPVPDEPVYREPPPAQGEPPRLSLSSGAPSRAAHGAGETVIARRGEEARSGSGARPSRSR